MRYIQPYGIADPNAPYVNGDPSIGRPGSIPPAEAFEHPMRELVSLIGKSGFTPSQGDLTQVAKAVRSQALNAQAAITLGANQYAVTLDPPVDAYTYGLPLRVEWEDANTGPATINVNNLGARQILRGNRSALQSGDLPVYGMTDLVYDGEAFQIVNFYGYVTDVINNNTYLVDLPFASDTGVVNAMVATYSPAPTIGDGWACLLRVGHTNTGPTTFNPNGHGNIPVVDAVSSNLVAGQLPAGQMVLLIYDATNIQFQVIGLRAGSSGQTGRVGEIVFVLGTSPPANAVKANGSILSKAAYPLLWSYAQTSGRLVTETQWWQNQMLNSFSDFGTGDDRFRIPHFMGQFMRAYDDGTGAWGTLDYDRRNPAAGTAPQGTYGQWQPAQNLAHTHSVDAINLAGQLQGSATVNFSGSGAVTGWAALTYTDARTGNHVPFSQPGLNFYTPDTSGGVPSFNAITAIDGAGVIATAAVATWEVDNPIPISGDVTINGTTTLSGGSVSIDGSIALSSSGGMEARPQNFAALCCIFYN